MLVMCSGHRLCVQERHLLNVRQTSAGRQGLQANISIISHPVIIFSPTISNFYIIPSHSTLSQPPCDSNLSLSCISSFCTSCLLFQSDVQILVYVSLPFIIRYCVWNKPNSPFAQLDTVLESLLPNIALTNKVTCHADVQNKISDHIIL